MFDQRTIVTADAPSIEQQAEIMIEGWLEPEYVTTSNGMAFCIKEQTLYCFDVQACVDWIDDRPHINVAQLLQPLGEIAPQWLYENSVESLEWVEGWSRADNFVVTATRFGRLFFADLEAGLVAARMVIFSEGGDRNV